MEFALVSKFNSNFIVMAHVWKMAFLLYFKTNVLATQTNEFSIGFYIKVSSIIIWVMLSAHRTSVRIISVNYCKIKSLTLAEIETLT